MGDNECSTGKLYSDYEIVNMSLNNERTLTLTHCVVLNINGRKPNVFDRGIGVNLYTGYKIVSEYELLE